MIFHFAISFTPQKIPLSKFLMTSLRVICGLCPPPNQKTKATPMFQRVVNPTSIFNIFYFIFQYTVNLGVKMGAFPKIDSGQEYTQ